MSEKLNFENVWAALMESREQMKELGEYLHKTALEMRASAAELKASSLETDRVVKDVSRQLGGMGNSNGAMAENYFFNSFDKTKMFGNEKFDYAVQNVRFGIKALRDEYDIVLYNGSSIGIIEVKYDAEKKDITQTINKATTFRQLFPMYKDFTFYLGIASFVFDKNVEKAALDAGLAVIKQVGDTVVVQDDRVKKF